MKEGKDFAGMILCILVATLSPKGKNLILERQLRTIDSQIYFLEIVLAMEEFLKHGSISRSELNSLEKMMIHFLNEINANCKRNTGVNNRLI